MGNPYYQDDLVTLHWGTAASVGPQLNPGSVRTIVTSPPYFGLRDYGHEDQIGAESSAQEYVNNLVATFAALRPALADDGTLWLNLGDSYASGSRTSYAFDPKLPERAHLRPKSDMGAKNLLGVPWRVAFALQADGWILRSDIIWAKPNPMPESVTDRPTKAHEYLFLFAKQPKYYYDAEAIAEQASVASIARLSQNVDAQAGSDRAAGGAKANGPMRASARPQLKRALALAKEHGLTPEHMDAIRAVGMNDAGKAKIVQSGAGKNDAEVQRLADEAKAALGGYYREFLSGGTVNKRTVWSVPTVPFKDAHFATYPPELIRPCILAGSARGDTVLDPFSGSGTTGMVATQEGRRYIGIDVNSDYLDLSLRTRFAEPVLDMTGGAA